ncbi:MAG: DUF111 family protein [Deltaproteobacteria bacterium]|nr:DUF111 family protein [Deltaproteobacteria bacterium]
MITAQGKKGRPVFLLKVLANREREAAVVDCLFRHSPTLGVRRQAQERYVLERKTSRFASPLGEVAIKTAFDINGEELNVKVEYDDLARLAAEHNLPLAVVERQVMAAWQARASRERKQ